MNRKNIIRWMVFGCIILLMPVMNGGCALIPPHHPGGGGGGKLIITSVNEKTMGTSSLSFRSKSEPSQKLGYEHAGPADYVKVKILNILIWPESGTEPFTVWEDEAGQEITLDGTGQLPTTLELNKIPEGTYKSVTVTMDSKIKIKGSIIGKTYKTSLPDDWQNVTSEQFNVATKSQYCFHWGSGAENDPSYVYNPVNNNIVTPAYSDYSTIDGTDAEETSIDLYFFPTISFTTPINTTIVEGEDQKLTFLLDLSRLIRFNNGCNTAGGEAGQGDVATFYENHLVFNLFACFVGEAGSVEGYEIEYNDSNNNNGVLSYGWLTMIWSPQHELIHAAVISDDHSLSPDGEVRNFTQDPESDTYQFDIVNDCIGGAISSHISGFKNQSEPSAATITSTSEFGMTGTATFTRQMVYQ